MTHLTPEEFVTALDGGADARVDGHLMSCRACRDELAVLGAHRRAVASVGVPEPSPLFWDHFARRVREATVSAPSPAASWWAPRRFVWTTGLAAATVVLAVSAAWWMAAPQGDPFAELTSAGVETTTPTGFEEVAEVFGLIPPEEVDAFAPGSPTTWAMVDDLTDAERAAFVRLIERELEALP